MFFGKVTEGPVESRMIAKRVHLGLQNIGVGFVLLLVENLAFMVAVFKASGEWQVKSESNTVRWAENKYGQNSELYNWNAWKLP